MIKEKKKRGILQISKTQVSNAVVISPRTKCFVCFLLLWETTVYPTLCRARAGHGCFHGCASYAALRRALRFSAM